MTTVINFNLLNFVKLNFSNYTVNNDVRAYSQNFENRNYNYPDEKNEVIDVTPYKPAVIDTAINNNFRQRDTQRTNRYITTSMISTTYDRRGDPIFYSFEKGLHVNSYA